MLFSKLQVHPINYSSALQLYFVYQDALCLNKSRIWGTCEVNLIYASTKRIQISEHHEPNNRLTVLTQT